MLCKGCAIDFRACDSSTVGVLGPLTGCLCLNLEPVLKAFPEGQHAGLTGLGACPDPAQLSDPADRLPQRGRSRGWGRRVVGRAIERLPLGRLEQRRAGEGGHRPGQDGRLQDAPGAPTRLDFRP